MNDAVDNPAASEISSESVRSANSYSPPPLFANVTTIAAAAGECLQVGEEDDDMDRTQVVDEKQPHILNGNADDFVIASKRRRRIEIPRIPKNGADAYAMDGQNATAIGIEKGNIGIIESSSDRAGVSGKRKESYLNNFCAGGVEFTKETNSEQSTESGVLKSENCLANALPEVTNGGLVEEQEKNPKTSLHLQKEQIKPIAELVAGKIKFLSEGRPAVSGVQVMAIQYEVSGGYGHFFL